MLMALHTAACVLALIQYKYAVRVGRMKTVFEKGRSLCSSVSVLWEGFCLEESLKYLVGPECFSIAVKAALLSAFVSVLVFRSVCVTGSCGNQLFSTTNEHHPHHQSCLSCFMNFMKYSDVSSNSTH